MVTAVHKVDSRSSVERAAAALLARLAETPHWSKILRAAFPFRTIPRSHADPDFNGSGEPNVLGCVPAPVIQP